MYTVDTQTQILSDEYTPSITTTYENDITIVGSCKAIHKHAKTDNESDDYDKTGSLESISIKLQSYPRIHISSFYISCLS